MGVGVCYTQSDTQKKQYFHNIELPETKTFFFGFAIFLVSSLILPINLEKWQKPKKKIFVLFLTLYYKNIVFFSGITLGVVYTYTYRIGC